MDEVVDKLCNTPATLCAAWGKSCGLTWANDNQAASTCEYFPHRLCGRNTSQGFCGELSTCPSRLAVDIVVDSQGRESTLARTAELIIFGGVFDR